jgi:hypothetical protein
LDGDLHGNSRMPAAGYTQPLFMDYRPELGITSIA